MFYFDLNNKRVYRDHQRIQLPKEKGNLADRPKTWDMISILAQKPDDALVPYQHLGGDDPEILQRHMRDFLTAIGEDAKPRIFEIERGVGYRVNKKGRFCVIDEGMRSAAQDKKCYPCENAQSSDANEVDVQESASLFTEYYQQKRDLFEMQQKIDQYVQKMETIQQKIEQAQSKNSALWVQLYSDQFSVHHDMLKMLLREAAEQRYRINRMMDEAEGRSKRSPSNALRCIPDPMLQMKDVLTSQEKWLSDADSVVRYFEALIEQAVQEVIFCPDCDPDSVQEMIDQLPTTRPAALALYRQVLSFDGVIELYDALFDRYREFLLPEEYEELVKRAKFSFEPAVVERWFIS